MFSTLRSRLWLTYALLIAGVLCVVWSGLLIYLLTSSPITRQTYQYLQVSAALLQSRDIQVADVPASELVNILQRADQNLGVRIAVLSADGDILLDSRVGNEPVIPTLTISQPRTRLQELTFRDSNRQVWLYVIRPLEQGKMLLVAVPRPRGAIRQLFREDLFLLMLPVGLLASIVALVLAVWISRWVTAPLEKITAATKKLSSGEYPPIPLEGPEEVQSLAHSFNVMAERVEAVQKSQRNFLANVSHELKTPLTSIQGYAQAILDGTAITPDAIQQAADVIYTEAGQMHRLVLDLLDLARFDSGIVELKRTQVDLSEVIHHVLEKMSIQARSAQVVLDATIEPTGSLAGDPDRLAQVFTNLLDNAIKFTPAGGRVTIKTLQGDDQVGVMINDTGAGIPAEDLPHIFERFYQVDKSRRSENDHISGGQGVGLGLAIAREIIHAHHGRIDVQSTPGQGSTFRVLIPCSSPDDSTLVHRRKSKD
jgi:signal transduction histidine kinase